MDSKQFAWFYLIKNGQANQRPAYYGGYETIDESIGVDVSNTKYGLFCQKHDDTCIALIRKHGIDWDRTQAPDSELVHRFAGTFCDSEMVEYMVGDLVLKNGQKITYYGESPTGNVFSMFENIESTILEAKEMFGL